MPDCDTTPAQRAATRLFACISPYIRKYNPCDGLCEKCDVMGECRRVEEGVTAKFASIIDAEYGAGWILRGLPPNCERDQEKPREWHDGCLPCTVKCECGVEVTAKTEDAAIATWNRRTREPGTSVVAWHRYGDEKPAKGNQIIRFVKGCPSAWVPRGEITENMWHCDDLWAYLPEPPEGANQA